MQYRTNVSELYRKLHSTEKSLEKYIDDKSILFGDDNYIPAKGKHQTL